tara:strand:- start:542 stop:889 length:348 start_codon:yes stop_codon:yes gene_type:complete
MANFHTQAMKAAKMNKEENILHDPIKESYLTAEVFKADKRAKSGKRYINKFDFKDMTEGEIIEHISEGWNPENGYSFKIYKTYVKRKNIMYGNIFYERYDTPHHCSASSESYWSN